MADIVPFGKYKNQPIGALAQDKEYCEWLVSQGWLAQRYPDLHTIIINNFADPAETPEHNALQLRFLEEELRLRVAMCMVLFKQPLRYAFREQSYPPPIAYVTEAMFEQRGIDVQWEFGVWYPYCVSETFANLHGKRIPKGTYIWRQCEFTLAVECKPSLGDDYPAVLRFLHSLPDRDYNERLFKVVIVENYHFRGGTIQQVQALFQSSGVLLLDMAGLEALPLIPCVKESDLPCAQEVAR